MWGRATLAMEVSSTSMKAASATVMAISQGLTLGFQRTPSWTLGFSIRAGWILAPGAAGNAAAFSDKSLLPVSFRRFGS